ncbi:MAG TPA: biotin transporter BioY [Thermoanaerobacterales bacterium]|nr:biotin transporter BioY [Thermoanaerobacterales bacterium]
MEDISLSTTNQLKQMILSAFFAALTAIGGYLAFPIPFSPVPVTAQTLAVMLAGNLLEPVSALWSMIVLISIGAIGLPVFSGGRAGIGVITGPTGGYILSWPIAVYLISRLLSENKKHNFLQILTVNVLGGIIIVYLLGILQLALVTGIGIKKAFLVGALPYLPGDIFKALAASFLAVRLKRII